MLTTATQQHKQGLEEDLILPQNKVSDPQQQRVHTYKAEDSDKLKLLLIPTASSVISNLIDTKEPLVQQTTKIKHKSDKNNTHVGRRIEQ
jgi:hypothetical protein